MQHLQGYQLTEALGEDSKTRLYRGIRESDKTAVIVRFLKPEYPALEEVKRMEYDYRITQELNVKGVLRPLALETAGHGKAIVLEDFEAIPLDMHIRTTHIKLRDFLEIAVSLTGILGEIHQYNIIHKNINPKTILINPNTNEVKISDFSIAARVRKETRDAVNPEKLEGTLAYISPEQTGRMNRSVDFRSDFYSLGATLYEVHTGKQLFAVNDSMELVHAHIARQPEIPEINSGTELLITDILLKLLAKTAEERYQSTTGLIADLEQCLDILQQRGSIENFQAGKEDIAERFQVPEKLYGRKDEIQILSNEFSKVARGEPRVIYFTGSPGVGKSFLVNEIRKPLVNEKGYFISGKFNQLKRDIPYSSFIQAFQDLTRQLLTESEEKIVGWKNKILEHVSGNGRLIIDVIPELELIIGPQPPVPELSAIEAQNRFNHVFLEFTKVFVGKPHPLVIFLDDLQWADTASLKLLQVILTDRELRYLFIIGAYRDNEVNKSHPFMIMLSSLKDTGYSAKIVELHSLDTDDIKLLVSDTLYREPSECEHLADLVKNKTDGNPFFVKEFLFNLYRENYIRFKKGWHFDMEQITRAEITGNVVELMANRVKKLPMNIQNILIIASCIGTRFYLTTLAEVYEKDEKEVFELLKEAINEGMIIKLEGSLQFAHDRVQEAVYTLVNEEVLARMHYAIGRKLLSGAGKERLEEEIFGIVNQLNKAIPLICSEDEKVELAGFNLTAGLRAKGAAAFEAAQQFFKKGVDILHGTEIAKAGNIWEKEYALVLALYTESGEAGYLTGNNEEAEKFFNLVLAHAATGLDKVRVYEIKMVNYTSIHKMKDALDTGIEALKMLGVNMPKKGTGLILVKELLLVQLNLGKKKIEELEDLPGLDDPHKLAIARLLIACAEPCYIGVPEYLPILILKLLNLSLRFGNSMYSSYAYILYGLIVSGTLGNIEKGYRFGELALKIQEKFNARELQCKVYFLFAAMITEWKNHIKETFYYMLEGYKSGLETGDLSFAHYCINNYLYNCFFSGEPLDDLKEKFDSYNEASKKLQQWVSRQIFNTWYQLVLHLRGAGEERLVIKGEIIDEEDVVPQWVEANQVASLSIYSVGKMLLLYLYEAYEEAITAARKWEYCLEGTLGQIFHPEFYFYYSISMIGHYPEAGKREQKKYSRQLKKNIKKMKKWAAHAPDNFEHKYFLIQAGITGVRGRVEDAIQMYNRAIQAAARNGFRQDHAIANEMAAKYYLSINIEQVATYYMKEAYYGYLTWGAHIKVNDLYRQYPTLLKIEDIHIQETGTVEATIQGESGTPVIERDILDLISIIKASNAISGEIALDKLLSKLILIVIENAGAEKGILILKKENALYLEAEGNSGDDSGIVLQSVMLEMSSSVPEAVIRFVERTQETIVLDDASSEKLFSDDPYIRTVEPRSVLCMPVLYQNKLTAILYLENNLGAGIFTPERQETLKLLGNQMAISLENAFLYDNLKQEMVEREAAEEKLRENERRFRLLVQNMPIMVNAFDSESKFVFWNRECEKITGYTQNEIIENPNVTEYLYPDPVYRSQILKEWGQRGNNFMDWEMILTDKQGNEKTILWTNISDRFPIPGWNNWAIGVDITERKKAEEQTRLHQEQLIQADKMVALGTLVSGVAHEINNPNNFIMLNAPILKKSWESMQPILDDYYNKKGDFPVGGIQYSKMREKLSKMCENILEGSWRIKRIVDDLRKFSRKSGNEIFDYVDINSVITSSVNLIRNQIKGATNNFTVNLGSSIPLIKSNYQHLEQVIINLIQNACQAITDKDHSISVTTSYEEDNDSVLIEVQDEGCGIAPEDLSRIFDPFFTTRLNSGGTGLGLSVSNRIIQNLEGTLSYTSTQGEGTLAKITLPIKRGNVMEETQ
ncbi:MAG: AAA family ATPase [bacterium]|nr:AAA family ATPase [bacterium]